MPPRSESYIGPASASPRLPGVCSSGAPPCAASWEQNHEETQARSCAGRPHPQRSDRRCPSGRAGHELVLLSGRQISFPFQARCVAANAISPLRKGETIEVLRLATENACEHDMLVQIRWQGRKMAVPLSQLEAIDANESTDEAIGDWHYWVAQGCIL